MAIIGGLLCIVIGAGCWWLNSASANVTINDPVLSSVIVAGSLLFIVIGMLFFIFGAVDARRFK